MEKLKCKYAIGTYEIDLLSEKERNLVFKKLNEICEYTDTAINYNNDYLLRKQNKIISKIAPCQYKYYDLFITEHLKCLNKYKIDIMLIHNNRGNWYDLAVKLNEDNRFLEVGVSNFNIQDLLKYKELIHEFPKYNEIEINPDYTDIETINFCKKNNIKIIAYCILGGKYNAMLNVATYSLPYLMSYAENYADIIILRADNEKQAEDFVTVAKTFKKMYNDFTPVNNIKSMLPLKYAPRKVLRFYKGFETYYTNFGENNKIVYKFKKEHKLNNCYNFEMLGDVKAYIRYLYTVYIDYNRKIYDKDMLLLNNKTSVLIHIRNEYGLLTKVINENCNIMEKFYEFD